MTDQGIITVVVLCYMVFVVPAPLLQLTNTKA